VGLPRGRARRWDPDGFGSEGVRVPPGVPLSLVNGWPPLASSGHNSPANRSTNRSTWKRQPVPARATTGVPVVGAGSLSWPFDRAALATRPLSPDETLRKSSVQADGPVAGPAPCAAAMKAKTAIAATSRSAVGHRHENFLCAAHHDPRWSIDSPTVVTSRPFIPHRMRIGNALGLTCAAEESRENPATGKFTRTGSKATGRDATDFV
jgi:hypothetical protein